MTNSTSCSTDDSGADTAKFDSKIWGGEDVRIGLYEGSDDIAVASRKTIEEMARVAAPIGPETSVLDIGAGFGSGARMLAKTYICKVDCLNPNRTQNASNESLTGKHGLTHLIKVVQGNIESIPKLDGRYDLAWSQDALVHSGRRGLVFSEVYRVLKSGGRFVFTDPMQADDCPAGALKDLFERFGVETLGSFAIYRETAKRMGFQELQVSDRSAALRTHYQRVSEYLRGRYDDLVAATSKDHIERLLADCDLLIASADKGHLAWGFMHFKKP